MFEPTENYPATTSHGQSIGLARMPTMKERITLAVKQAEDRLAAAKEAQAVFERNPDLETLINALQRGGF